MGKAKVTVKGVEEIGEKLKKFLKSIESDKETLNLLGQEMTTQIKNRTRGRLEEYKQPQLQKSTVKRRETLINQGNGSELASPKRSNLTLSGQLLDAISYKINESSSKVTIYLKEQRQKYRGKKGQLIGDDKSNSEIARDLKSRGFEFLFISEKLLTLLENKLKQHIRRKLAQYRKVKRSLK